MRSLTPCFLRHSLIGCGLAAVWPLQLFDCVEVGPYRVLAAYPDVSCRDDNAE